MIDFTGSFLDLFVYDFGPDPASVDKFLQVENVSRLLIDLGGRYAESENFTEQETEKILRDFATEKGVKAGALINGARVALTGQAVAPSLFAVMQALGKVKVTSRLKATEDIVTKASVVPK